MLQSKYESVYVALMKILGKKRFVYERRIKVVYFFYLGKPRQAALKSVLSSWEATHVLRVLVLLN